MLIKFMRKNSTVDRFVRHNKQVFMASIRRSQDRPIVLMELNLMRSAHIAYSYLANALKEEFKAQIIAYEPKANLSLRKKLSYKFSKYFSSERMRVYRSFGVVDFLAIKVNSSQKIRARLIFDNIFNQLDSNWDIEAIHINGVYVGDLIYDTYLARFKKPTIDKSSRQFQDFLLESIELFVYWEDYLNFYDVCAINVSHCVYNLAIPLRLGVERGIHVFQINATHAYRLSKSNYFAYNDFRYFRERFALLPEEVRVVGLYEARRRIQRRFSGEIGVDMSYSTKSAYGASFRDRLLHESDRKKILIATHCFFDSPHSYGNNIFPDFYEWLDFLGGISQLTDYDWYIKTHPDYLPGTMEIILGFVEKYPKFTLLPSDASHHQIVAEGIDVALTVYGTIAFEYAALGLPVINCSSNNPHIAYGFNCHPKSVEDYRQMLLNLDHLNLKIDKQEVYEYYFMKFIYNTENIFFENYDAMLKKLGGYAEQFTPRVYEEWINEWSIDKHQSILSALSSYIRSDDFRMDYRHFGRDFDVDSIKITS